MWVFYCLKVVLDGVMYITKNKNVQGSSNAALHIFVK